MITLNAVSFAYPHAAPLFSGFTWQVAPSEAWAVLGPSGEGKTTLLYLLAGLRFPTSGSITFDGLPLTRPRPQTGLILQDYGLLPWNTVLDNVRLGQRIRALYGPDGKHAPPTSASAQANDRQTALDWLTRLGLSKLAQQYPGQLSGGQRQRVAIARTLLLQPDLLLMDEPFSSLDAATRESLRSLILDLWQEQHFTFVVVTHAIEEAIHLGQKILILGQSPHRHPQIIANHCFSSPDPESHPAYPALVHTLRAAVRAQAAFSGGAA